MAVTSCQKDEGATKFSATMEPNTANGKTELVGTNVQWVAGDEVAEVELKTSFREYEVDVDARTGDILKNKSEIDL